MVYGKGAGITGGATVIGGVAVLPNTSGNTTLLVLSIATIVTGSLILLSFIATRIALRYYR